MLNEPPIFATSYLSYVPTVPAHVLRVRLEEEEEGVG